MEKIIKAGKIASRIKTEITGNITAGMKIRDIITEAEEKIIKQKAGLAFPTTISINSITSHYTTTHNDPTILLRGDLVKIDLGVEIDGYIADTATSTIIEGENPTEIPETMPGRTQTNNTHQLLTQKQELVETAHDAVNNAISIIREGTTIAEIGKTIQKTANRKNLHTIPNITGHNMKRYRLHAGTIIPNTKNTNTTALKEGDIIAIEPYITLNNNNAVHTDRANIYSYLRDRPFKNSDTTRLLEVISRKHRQFPFALRHLEKENINNIHAAFEPLVTSRAVFPYLVMVQPDNHPVAQIEHTIIVEKRGCTVTTQ